MEQLEHYIQGIVHVDWLTTALAAAVILAVTAVFARLTVRFMRKMLHYNEEKNLPSSSIFVNIARGAVWLLGVCIMLSTCYGVDVSAAITALGIGGIAISLGFQDTIANLIGGLQVSLLRIIKPGDNIEVGSSSGVVKDITWRHTTIRNSKGEEVIIPNSIINKTALTHLPPTNQVSLPIVVVTPGEHLNDVAAAIEHEASEAAGAVAKLTKEPKLSFSAITDGGYVGSITFKVADSRTSARAGDA
ncbi:mechanosensitive ion channel family protein, partial [Gordonibacter pamelaeae]